MTVLRAGTYLAPSIPVEYFEAILHYLESKLNIHTTLLYESRWEGPSSDREDPFKEGVLDLAWMSSTSFLRLAECNSPVKLLEIAPVYQHLRGEERPGYYVDVIIHKDLSEKVKEFHDLRGCKWAYNNKDSLSGHVLTLATLKDLGENATFFGNILFSVSHLESIKMVIGKKVDAAAVDANCLASFLDKYPHFSKDIKVLTSWGTLPPNPIVVNQNMPEDLQNKITSCLLKMDQDKAGAKKLEEFSVLKFAPITVEDYNKEKLMKDRIKGLTFGAAYY